MLTSEQLDHGCTCQVSGRPPCSFCTNMDEKEVYAYTNHGIEGLRVYIGYRGELGASLRAQGLIADEMDEFEEMESAPERPSETLTMYATNGLPVEVRAGYAGMKTGYACVVNGYVAGVEGFDKHSDGWTVVEGQPGWSGSKPVADAYQELEALFEEEEVELAQHEHTLIESGEDPEIWGTMEEWAARYRPRVVARVLAAYRDALGDPCPLTVNLIAEALVRAGVQA